MKSAIPGYSSGILIILINRTVFVFTMARIHTANVSNHPLPIDPFTGFIRQKVKAKISVESFQQVCSEIVCIIVINNTDCN